jgi:hypothetical protein
VLASQQGWRVAELPVNHRPRAHGRSRFGLERYIRGALDLLTVIFIGRYQHRPLHLFGGIGIGLTLIGLVVLLYLTILKIGGEAIGERPLLFLGVLLLVVGVQLLSLGLVGQMLVLMRRDHPASAQGEARVQRTLNLPPAVSDADRRQRSATEMSASPSAPRDRARAAGEDSTG